MLAQNFMPAEALGIKEPLHLALIKVLGMLERGEIKSKKFNMRTIGKPQCGTAGCIQGWAKSVDNRILGLLMMERSALFNGAKPYLKLCIPNHCKPAWHATPAQAAIALRTFLTTGHDGWEEAMTE